jgi:hypothetical protein
VAQQQAGALPLRQGGEGLAHRPLLLGAEHVHQRGRAGVGLVVDPPGPGRPVQPVAGPALAPQPVVGGVQADTAQPGRDLLVGPVQDRVPVQLEEGLLHDVLGLAVVAEQPVREPVQVAVPLPEHGDEPFPGAGPGPNLIPHGTHQPLLHGQVWSRYLSPLFNTAHPVGLTPVRGHARATLPHRGTRAPGSPRSSGRRRRDPPGRRWPAGGRSGG